MAGSTGRRLGQGLEPADKLPGPAGGGPNLCAAGKGAPRRRLPKVRVLRDPLELNWVVPVCCFVVLVVLFWCDAEYQFEVD